MSTRNLESLFRPRSVAIQDATPDAAGLGGALVQNHLRAGFQGSILLLDPTEAGIGGLRTYRRPADLPEVPDLALIGGPANSVPGAIHDFGSLGTRVAIVFSSDFDLDTREATLAAAGSHMLRVLGPDSVGLIVPELGLNASTARVPPRPGDVAFVSQSAAVLSAAAGFSHSHGNGFSCIVSLGGAADVDAADLLDYFSADPGTRAIGLHVESIAVARSSCRRLAPRHGQSPSWSSNPAGVRKMLRRSRAEPVIHSVETTCSTRWFTAPACSVCARCESFSPPSRRFRVPACRRNAVEAFAQMVRLACNQRALGSGVRTHG